MEFCAKSTGIADSRSGEFDRLSKYRRSHARSTLRKPTFPHAMPPTTRFIFINSPPISLSRILPRTVLSNLLLQLLQETPNAFLQLLRPILQLSPWRLQWLIMLHIRLTLRRSINLLMDRIIRHQRLRDTQPRITTVIILRETSWRCGGRMIDPWRWEAGRCDAWGSHTRRHAG